MPQTDMGQLVCQYLTGIFPEVFLREHHMAKPGERGYLVFHHNDLNTALRHSCLPGRQRRSTPDQPDQTENGKHFAQEEHGYTYYIYNKEQLYGRQSFGRFAVYDLGRSDDALYRDHAFSYLRWLGGGHLHPWQQDGNYHNQQQNQPVERVEGLFAQQQFEQQIEGYQAESHLQAIDKKQSHVVNECLRGYWPSTILMSSFSSSSEIFSSFTSVFTTPR